MKVTEAADPYCFDHVGNSADDPSGRLCSGLTADVKLSAYDGSHVRVGYNSLKHRTQNFWITKITMQLHRFLHFSFFENYFAVIYLLIQGADVSSQETAQPTLWVLDRAIRNLYLTKENQQFDVGCDHWSFLVQIKTPKLFSGLLPSAPASFLKVLPDKLARPRKIRSKEKFQKMKI